MNKLADTNKSARPGGSVKQNGRGASVGLTDRLAALSEPIRLRLLRLLEQEEMSVGEVAKVVQMPQSTVSRHLKILHESGWARRRTSGTASYYRLSHDDLTQATRALWRTVREQMEETASIQEDERRLGAVLAERRTDSLSFFGRVSGEWDAIRTELFGSGFTERALAALLSPDSVVADLGCGTGNASEHIAPFVDRVIAVDGSRPMLDAAEKRLADFNNIKFVEGDITDLPLENGSIDAALCVLVIHHLESPLDALREFHRVLRPGGAALVIDMYEHDRSIYRETMGHSHLGFSQARIEALMTEAGFDRIRVTPLRSSGDAKGPGLFAATGRKQTSDSTNGRRVNES